MLTHKEITMQDLLEQNALLKMAESSGTQLLELMQVCSIVKELLPCNSDEEIIISVQKVFKNIGEDYGN